MVDRANITIPKPTDEDIATVKSLRKKNNLDYRFGEYVESNQLWPMHYMLTDTMQPWLHKLDFNLDDDRLLALFRSDRESFDTDAFQYLINLAIDREIADKAIGLVANGLFYSSSSEKFTKWMKKSNVTRKDLSDRACERLMDQDNEDLSLYLIENIGYCPQLEEGNFARRAVSRQQSSLLKIYLKKYQNMINQEPNGQTSDVYRGFLKEALCTSLQDGKKEFLELFESAGISVDFSSIKAEELEKWHSSSFQYYSDKGVDVFKATGVCVDEFFDRSLRSNSTAFLELSLKHGADLTRVSEEALFKAKLPNLKFYAEAVKKAGIENKIEKESLRFFDIAIEKEDDKYFKFVSEHVKVACLFENKSLKKLLDKGEARTIKKIIDAKLYNDQDTELMAKLYLKAKEYSSLSEIFEELDKLPLERFDVTVNDNEMLFRAVKSFEMDRVRQLIAVGADVTARKGEILIEAATSKDNADMAKYLMRVADGALDKYVEATLSKARYRDRYNIISFFTNLPKWEVLNDGEISYTSSFEKENSKLKKVFNFYAGTVTSIYENVKAKTQHVETRNFNEFQLDGDIQNAYKRLKFEGANTPEYHGIRFQQGASVTVARASNVNHTKVKTPAPSKLSKK